MICSGGASCCELHCGLLHRYDLLQPPDGVWGVKLNNGFWTGMVGMVARHVSIMDGLGG